MVVPLLVVLVLVGAEVALEDDWVSGVSNAGDNGIELLRAVSRGLPALEPAIPAPVRICVARVLVPAERRAPDWIVVTPTDRAPPRA